MRGERKRQVLPSLNPQKQVKLESAQAVAYNPAEIAREDYQEDIEKDAISPVLQDHRWHQTAIA